MNLKQKKDLYLKASDYYYNSRGRTKLTDAEFDALEKEIRAADPKWDQLAATGVVVVNKKTEVPLEHFMPSLRKVYPEDADKIQKWTAKLKSMLVMNKLDGGSLQLTYNKGHPTKLVTRGNGILGGDISFLLPHLNLPKIVLRTRVVFRCEALMPLETFERKYSKDFENARNCVNGWLNRMKPHAGLKDVDIVVLGIYGLAMQAGLKQAKAWGFKVVVHNVFEPSIGLGGLLATRLKKSVYEMDGLVLCDASQVLEYADAEKPKFMVAYKENEDLANATKATVEAILWQDSPKSRLIPKIKIRPVRIGGTTVTYATCHNAKWMVDRGIGTGAVIQIVRSGDVIPKIVGVLKKGKLQLPGVPYVQKGVHFVATHRSAEADVRALHKFFKTLGVEFLASKTIAMLYEKGITTPQQYMAIWQSGSPSKLVSAGVGKAMSAKIYDELDRVFAPGVLLRTLMVASNVFDSGLGDRKLKAVEKYYKHTPMLMTSWIKNKATRNQIMADLVVVPSFKDKSAALIADGMPAFVTWLREALKYIKVIKPNKVKASNPKGPLAGITVSFTSYRDKAHEQWVTDNGGQVIPFGSKTQYLVHKEGAQTNTKLDKAKAKGIKVMTFADLKKAFK